MELPAKDILISFKPLVIEKRMDLVLLLQNEFAVYYLWTN